MIKKKPVTAFSERINLLFNLIQSLESLKKQILLKQKERERNKERKEYKRERESYLLSGAWGLEEIEIDGECALFDGGSEVATRVWSVIFVESRKRFERS